VTYNGNENTGGTVPVDPSSPYKAGSTVTVLGTGGISRSGYLFIGWNTAADGSGSSYPAASTFTVTGNTVLYAQWTPSYTVTYSNYLSNGGGAPPVDILSPYAAGSTVTVLDNNHPYPEGPLVRAGYTFLGWYPAGFVHAGTYYVAGNTIVITSDITLLPYWEEDIS
jgi:uncharacterized repeat protein (TIGR02543 family)